MLIKVKTLIIIIALAAFMFTAFSSVYSSEEDNNLTLVYISDLNLLPTPSVSQREKHELEKTLGLLVYESQAIFQDIVKYINQNIASDLVVFGGNNVIASNKAGFFMDTSDELVWNLFLDMASEIKANFLINLGQNEILSKSKNGIVQIMKSFAQDITNTYWSYKIKDHLLIGLDTNLFFVDEKQGKLELEWLEELLLKNKLLKTVIFTHKSLLTSEGVIIDKKPIKELFSILDKNPQVVLLASGGEYLNRVTIIKHLVYVQNSSPIAFPCTFRTIQLTPDMLKIKTVKIPLKGIIKKAEESLIESGRAKELSQASIKNIKKYVKGIKSDADFRIFFRDLSNR